MNFNLILDFDGVILESNLAKTKAFYKLFEKFGDKIQKKVVKHHILNGGMSRYQKILFYYNEYLNTQLSKSELIEQCNFFSELVYEDVINSKYVKGFKNFISSNKFKQKFIVTATPQLEIERIVDYLKIKKYIKHIYGSPKTKIENLKKINFKFSINYNQSLFIGDSLNDYLAARKLNIKFALRLNSENKFIRNINTYKFNNFLDFNINDFIKYHK